MKVNVSLSQLSFCGFFPGLLIKGGGGGEHAGRLTVLLNLHGYPRNTVMLTKFYHDLSTSCHLVY